MPTSSTTKRISPNYRLLSVSRQQTFQKSKKVNQFLVPPTIARTKLSWIPPSLFNRPMNPPSAWSWHDLKTNKPCTFDWDDVVIAGSGGYLWHDEIGTLVMGFKLPDDTKLTPPDFNDEYLAREIYIPVASVFGYHAVFPQTKSMLVWLKDVK